MAITHYKFTVCHHCHYVTTLLYVLLIFSCGHFDILKVLYIHTLDALTVVFKYFFLLFMAALWNRAGHYIFGLWFLLCSFFLSSFFPSLISAVAVWISTILPHMMWP